MRTCSIVCGLSLHGGQIGSLSFFHLKRLFLEENWSYIERIRKLNLRGAICHMLFQVIDFYKVSSQLIYCFCWDCWTLFRKLLLSTSLLTSWRTISRQFLLVVFDCCCFSLVPKPCFPVWACLMISLKARLSLALLLVSLTFYFFPVFNGGFTDFITSSSIIWGLLIWMVILILLVCSTKQHQASLEVNPTIFGYIYLF